VALSPIFFGGGGSRGPRKTDDIVHELQVTLDDLYNGKTSKLAVTRNVLCATCKGNGTKSGSNPGKCKKCEGKGFRFVVKQFGPSMIQQMQTVCNDCGGKGETIKEEDKCKDCLGKKVTTEKKIIHVYIDKGMKHGQKITYPGDADEAPGCEPGDIIFVLVEKKHDVFQRQGNNLKMDYSLTLLEALTGFSFTITHLDGRILYVKSEKGDIIIPDDVRTIANEGMPTYKKPYEKGHLYIHFHVEFPAPGSFNDAQLKQLEQLLPPRKSPIPKQTEDMETVELLKSAPSNNKPKGGRGESFEEDGEDGEQRGQRVQCAQQ